MSLIDHILEFMLDYILDYMIISFVTKALELLSFLV